MSTSTTRTPKPQRETEAENSATVAQLNYDYESDKQLYLPSHWSSQNLGKFLALYPSPTAAAAACCRHTHTHTHNQQGGAGPVGKWIPGVPGRHQPVCQSSDIAQVLGGAGLSRLFSPSRDDRNIHGGAGLAFFHFFSVRFPGEAFASVVTTTSPREICFDAYSLCIAQNTMKKGWKANPSTMTPFLNPSNCLVLSTGTRSWFWVLFGRSFFSKREILLMFDWSG